MLLNCVSTILNVLTIAHFYIYASSAENHGSSVDDRRLSGEDPKSQAAEGRSHAEWKSVRHSRGGQSQERECRADSEFIIVEDKLYKVTFCYPI